MVGITQKNPAAHIKVVVRIRPQNAAEEEGGFRKVVEPLDDHMLVFDPKQQSSPEYFHGRRVRGRNILTKANRDVRYAFDNVFGPETTNEEVFQISTKDIVSGIFEGYNCSVFAYGATGAGKTFTMLGTQESPGVIFLTMMDLYQRIEDIKCEKTCEVSVSYLEVYNEQIRDLLQPGGFLPIREDPEKGPVVNGLSLHKPQSAVDLMELLSFGNQNRTQHPTDANAESSRSHAVFQVFVRQKDRTANLSADFSMAKMSLIDLAGSERATVTKNRGTRFREGANINRSLLALGNCINALADGKKKNFIPYRNSKLTRLLKDSLGGNCQTVMIAAVSPSAKTYEDTHNTLKYANRAKNIKATLKRNVVSVDYHLNRYPKIVQELRIEVAELKSKLALYETGSALLPTGQSAVKGHGHAQAIISMQSRLTSVFSDRVSITKELMELEAIERTLQLKYYLKEKELSILPFVMTGTAMERASNRLEEMLARFNERRSLTSQKRIDVLRRQSQNDSLLAEIEKKSCDLGGGKRPELLDAMLNSYNLEIEVRGLRRQAKFHRRMIRALDRETQTNHKLNLSLLQMMQSIYMSNPDALGTELKKQYVTIKQQLSGVNQGVAWADQNIGDDTLGLGNQSMLDETCILGNAGQKDSSQIQSLITFPVEFNPLYVQTPTRLRSTLTSKESFTPLSTMKGTPSSPSITTPGSLHRGPTWNKSQRWINSQSKRAKHFHNLQHHPIHSFNTKHHVPDTRPLHCQELPSQTTNSHTNDKLLPHPQPKFHHQIMSPKPNVSIPQSPLSLPDSTPQHHGISFKHPSQSKQQFIDEKLELKNPCSPSEKSHNLNETIALPSSSLPNLPSVPDTPKVPGTLQRTDDQHELNQTICLAASTVRNAPEISGTPVAPSGSMIHRNLEDTFTVAMGLAPLVDSPVPAKPILKSNIQLTNNLNITQTLDSDTNVPLDCKTISNRGLNPFDESNNITKMKITESPYHKGNIASSSGIQNKTCNSGTVTKSKPVNPHENIVDISATVTKAPSMTASQGTLHNNHPHVVRSMDFNEMAHPSPAGKLTYVDVVKTPQRVKIQQMNQLDRENNLVRSPLASCENMIRNTVNKGNNKMPTKPVRGLKRTKSFNDRHDAGKFRPATSKTFAQPLRNVPGQSQRLSSFSGKPKMSDIYRKAWISSNVENNETTHDNVPNYMQMTKAASRRQRNHRRSMSSSEMHNMNKEKTRLKPKRVLVKSKSTMPQRQQLF